MFLPQGRRFVGDSFHQPYPPARFSHRGVGLLELIMNAGGGAVRRFSHRGVGLLEPTMRADDAAEFPPHRRRFVGC